MAAKNWAIMQEERAIKAKDEWLEGYAEPQ
jgi:hypothetical protein